MATATLTTNVEKLKDLMVDVFLIDPRDFHANLKRDEIETWDSLGVVSLAVGVQETFDYHLSQDEVIGIKSVRDIIDLLEARGISFNA